MARSVFHTAAFCLIVCLAAASPRAEEARVPVANGGALVIPLPEGWRARDEAGPVPTVSLSPAQGPQFQVLVSPLVLPGGRIGPTSPEAIRSLVESGAAKAQSQAVEKELPLRKLRSPSVEGWYFAATDRAPKPGEYKYMTQGAFAVGGLPTTFTILTNENSRSAVASALRMLEGARRE